MPFSFHNPQPNLNALTTQLQNDDSDEESDDDEETTSNAKSTKLNKKSKDASTASGGVYVPPKLSAVHYDGEDSKAERSRKQMERARKRALK